MGYNVAGIITTTKIENEAGINSLLGTNASLVGNVDFDEATSMEKEPGVADVFAGEGGSVIFTFMTDIYDLSETTGEVMQFIISDVSDTYYFEKYNDGELVRKLIVSQGEIHEDEGEDEDINEDTVSDFIWEYIENVINEDIYDCTFVRYTV